MPTAPTYRTRPLTWVLLSLLLMLIVMASLPAFFTAGWSQLIQSIGVVIAIIVLIIGIIMIRRMNTRLANLAVVARAIGQGEYTTRATDTRKDAIGLLAHAVNDMATQVENAVLQLEKQQAELESNRQTLQQRNAQLAQEFEHQTSFGTFLEAINTVDINTLAQKGLDYLMQLTDGVLGQCYVCETASQHLQKIAEQGIDRNAMQQLTPGDAEAGLPGQALARGHWIVLDEIAEQVFPKIALGFVSAQVRTIHAIPILFQGKGLGVLIIASLHGLAENRRRNVQNTVDALGSALNNAVTYKTVQQQALRLEQANQELLEADRLRSEFVANMSHELRTPLNSIIGFSSILLKNRKGSLSPQNLKHSEKIHRNGKHLLNLINDILDLSKIEAGRMELSLRTTSLPALAGDTLDMLQTQAHAHNISLRLETDPKLPSALYKVETDPDKLRQVLINLLGNAIKFTEQGEVVLRLFAQTEPAQVILAVQDSGIGIAQDKLQTIFEPFRQADGSTTRKYGGTGLGLTITESIVRMLGGTIEVESTPGVGSTFSVRLPVDAQPTVAAATPISAPTNAESSAASTHPMPAQQRVLVVDDDPDARELLSNYIRDLGASPISAENGQQALQMARTEQPALITLDLMMPGMDGWEVLRQFKADPRLQAIPIVVISIVADRRRALLLGAIEALTKPVAQDDLLRVLQRSLQPPQGRILVVDDDPDIEEMYKNLLQGRAQEIRSASNGKEALHLLEDYQPDLIFLDMMMPEMDGLRFLRILRAEKRLMNLPVAIVTAKQLSDAERRELETRVIKIIEKGDNTLEAQLQEIFQYAIEHLQT